MKTFAIIFAVAVTTVQGYGFEEESQNVQPFAEIRAVRQHGSGARRGGGGRGWGWGAGQQQPISGNGGYGGSGGGGFKPQKPVIDSAPISGGGGYGGASIPLKPVIPSSGGPKPSISRPSGPVSGYLSGGGRAPAPLRPAPMKPIVPAPAFSGSGLSSPTGARGDSYSSPPAVKPGYGVPKKTHTGPVGYGR